LKRTTIGPLPLLAFITTVAPGYATHKRAMGERLTGSLFSILNHINPTLVRTELRKFELEAALIPETNSLADCTTQKVEKAERR